MSKGLILGMIMLAAATTLVVIMSPSMNSVLVKPAFASGGGCSTCASSFTPKSQSSSVSGTGEHGVEKEFCTQTRSTGQ